LAEGTSIDRDEVAKFAAMAGGWWDPEGDFRPLHRLNPTRLAFLRDHACTHFARDPGADRPLAGLEVLDVGCGGGLLCEPLARLGAEVTGIDAAGEAVAAADWHAEQSGLEIEYHCTTAEDLAAAGRRFDLVVNMEVVEHVADVDRFVAASCDLVKPGGAMAVATLNRTPKAFLLAVVGAEYVLGWLPRGTHDWRRFLRPSELVRRLDANGLTVKELTGVTYNPLDDRWRRSRDLDVNYMLFAVRG
jgi:2-polyprenyl-6-hydroxyphenyl methylase / 3-demethylubiquinone-9 3-methyltransferase